jgi:DNA polymerase-3 subunit alpha
MWVPLHVHSQYSILDATAPIHEIAHQAAAFEMPAVALTDHGNLYGAVDFYKECNKVKVKPILGCEFYVAPGSRFEKSKSHSSGKTQFHLGLLAKNEQGYKNLCKLSSLGFLEGFYYHPRIDRELLTQYREGLICLSGCVGSHLSYEILHGTPESINEMVAWYHALFGEDYYFEIQRHPMQEEELQAEGMYVETWLYQQYQDSQFKREKINQTLIELADRYKIPLVATNDSHYIHRTDWHAHEILLNIQSGEPAEIWEKDSQGNPKFRVPNPKRRTYDSHTYDFKSPEQMQELFKDIPRALSNTLIVAEKCSLELDFSTKHYPMYIPPGFEKNQGEEKERRVAVEKFLWNLCEQGIGKRYTEESLREVKKIYPDRDPLEVVRERLQWEMSVIVPKEMCDYFLIVWDFIHWAKQQGIPMGPGRGSGVGSIVLYLIGITDIEPLRFHLFFERFINPERIAYPDIDVDICMEQRPEVINYTLQKYGKGNVAQIITFGTMKARMTIKDVGRVLNIPLSKVNAIAKLVPEDLNITLEKALEKDQDLRLLYEQDEDAQRIIDIGKKLEGSIRNTGIHAAGIIISGQPLCEYIPLCNAKDSDMLSTQYSMKPVELVGMLKIDFLGLKTLTAIQMCTNAVQVTTQNTIDWVNLPLNDQATFDLLNKGKTMGVFQLESPGMQDLARQLHLDRFEEIIAVGALYRPGPMDMIPSFIQRKHGREPIDYDHPWMKEILSETYGIMVYQEQVMQIASKLAQYTLGEGDVLRRAMGKKEMEQMTKQREKFREGALKNGIEEAISMRIFDKIEKFAAYGFNKSHAAAYGYLSYVTAYLKAHHPKEWMAALMTCDIADLTKVAKFIRECQSQNIPILPPDINEAEKYFVATTQGIRFAMAGIKGVGEGVVEVILQERKKGGAFTSLYQFLERIDTGKVGKKTVECLVEAGSFDFTGWSREALALSVESMFESAVREQKEKRKGVMTLFSLMGETAETPFLTPPQVRHPRSPLERALREKELLGFFLTEHPMDQYRHILKQLSCTSLHQVENMEQDDLFRAAFLVESIQIRLSSKTQKKFAILGISDGIDRYELPIWAELYEEKSSLLHENQLLYAILQVDRREEIPRLSCRWLEDLTQADDKMISLCDQAYDRLKNQIFRSEKARKNRSEESVKESAKKMKEPSQKAIPSILRLAVDTKHLKLSQILSMKEIFAKYRGTTPIEISFKSEGSELATLHIDTRWGVHINDQLHLELQKMGITHLE